MLAFLFLYQADWNYIRRTRRQLRNEERRSANQRRPLSDFESVQWLNQALDKIWLVFLEEFISQQVLTPLIPWFLDKYKPWTARKAILRCLYLGSNPPLFTAVRTLDQTADDDHLVMDLHMDFLAAEDMNAVLAVQMRRRIGLGIWTNIHISRLQIEGKVRVGVRFLNAWPFLSRVRLCFEDAPYVQMTARPLSNHGLNVSDLPGVAGWMEKMMADVFEQSLVEPNMLVLDVERLLSSGAMSTKDVASSFGDSVDIQVKAPIAFVHLEILEASELKPSDPNGLADPFVKGAFATFRFKTKVRKKTLTPKWKQEFKLPIASWDLPTLVVLHVCDKDQIRDDKLGYCEVDISKFRGGQRHDLWIPLKDIKMGRVHIAVKVVENEVGFDDQSLSSSFQSSDLPEIGTDPLDEKSPVFDEVEEISTGNFEDEFVSILRPGQPVAKNWEPRQAKSKFDGSRDEKGVLEAVKSETLDTTTSDEASEKEMSTLKPRRRRLWRRRLTKPNSGGSPRNPKNLNLGRVGEVLAVGNKGTTVRMRVEEPDQNGVQALQELGEQIDQPDSPALGHETSRIPESPNTSHNMKAAAKNIMKHAGNAAHNISHALNRKGSGRESMKESRSFELMDSTISPAEISKHSEEKPCISHDRNCTTIIPVAAEKPIHGEEKSNVSDRGTPHTVQV